ncbi:EAL and HDOD domain-containing protein [Candidatus Neomarinimicrobiota bacterium]
MTRLIARQPLFDAREKVKAYDLVFSFDPNELFSDEKLKTELPDDIRQSLYGSNGAGVTTPINDVSIEVGPEFILNEDIKQLSRKNVVLYIPERFDIDQQYLDAIRAIREDGFKVALGPFATEDEFRDLAVLADQVVVDFRAKSESDLRIFPVWCKSHGIKTIAHNLVSRQDFIMARRLEYSYFHGSFFYKPEYVEKSEIPGFKLNYLRLLQEINQSDISFDRLNEIIKQDVSLSYKLLKYINSAAFGLRNEIESIKHALTMLGLSLVKRWSSLVAIANIGEGLPEEALVTCMIRGRFLEELGKRIGKGDRGDDLFFMGIFSMIDLFFSRPLEEILKEMPLKNDIKLAILGQGGEFSDLLSMVKSYEDGDWDPLQAQVAKLGINEDQVPEIYFDTLDWAQKLFR